ncbi:hypothetical protein [Spiroplasma endosymbiont of Polydrusus formosus]
MLKYFGFCFNSCSSLTFIFEFGDFVDVIDLVKSFVNDSSLKPTPLNTSI